jgi:hypothetical protein
MKRILVRVEAADALDFECDILAVKYAQAEYGLDSAVLGYLRRGNPKLDDLLPRPGSFKFFDGANRLRARRILVVGVQPLALFAYPEIRDFGVRVVTYAGRDEMGIRHIAVTLHGPGFGLDETEAFKALIGGLDDAVRSGQQPGVLERITIVERNAGRAERLRVVLEGLIENGYIELRDSGGAHNATTQNVSLKSAGYASAAKPLVFVAMPFADSMDDTFHYGIQGAVNAAGYLCERADLATFTGDVMEWVKRRIRSARLVIADLSSANPNVYLEVGYAWGCGIPTVLLISNSTDLKFDVAGQRCLVYKSIRALEEALAKELSEFPAE